MRDWSIEKADAGLKDSQADALREAMLAPDGGSQFEVVSWAPRGNPDGRRR